MELRDSVPAHGSHRALSFLALRMRTVTTSTSPSCPLGPLRERRERGRRQPLAPEVATKRAGQAALERASRQIRRASPRHNARIEARTRSIHVPIAIAICLLTA